MNEKNKEALRERIIGLIVMTYFIPMMYAVPYFNWEYAQKNGFITWVMLGQFVPTAQAFVWPYYVWEHYNSPPPGPPSKAKIMIEKLGLAMRYNDSIADALNQLVQKPKAFIESKENNPVNFLANCTSQQDLLNLLHKAVDTGDSIDELLLNGMYPELGTRFKEQWLKSMHLLTDACESGSEEKLKAFVLPSQEWAVWYGEHGPAVSKALNSVSR